MLLGHPGQSTIDRAVFSGPAALGIRLNDPDYFVFVAEPS
jgi:hypothetical protein